MGKLVSIAGNLGAGKTTLTKLLCEEGGFTPYWEKPEEHPFQKDFTADMQQWAFANQMEFLLFRCEQERRIRQDDKIAVMDGGFDQDFHVFTKNLVNKGYLSREEYRFFERFYRFGRDLLAPPEIIVRIVIDMPTLLQRRIKRSRKTVDQSFTSQELVDIELLLDDWLNGDVPSKVITFPFEQDVNRYSNEINQLIRQIRSILPIIPNNPVMDP
jgi:deoxyadenosine/deoxycytidine kinase